MPPTIFRFFSVRCLAVAVLVSALAATASAFEVMEATIADVHAAYRSGKLTSKQLVQLYLDRIAAYDQQGPALRCIVALNPDTGQYVWHYQENPGDNWDYTATQTLILADLNIDGRQRKVVLHAPNVAATTAVTPAANPRPSLRTLLMTPPARPV